MPRLIPESPVFVNDAERVVWQRLRDGLGPDDVVLANLRLTDETKDHEADLVVLMPGVGILVLEVKGGPVWVSTRSATGLPEWWMKRKGADTRVDPVEQVRTTKYAVRDYVRQGPRWGRRNFVAWGHGVVTPHADWDGNFSLPDFPRWALHGRGDQADLAERVRTNALRMQHGKLPPTHDEVDLIVEILAGRRATSYDVSAEAAEWEERADRLTQEQALILNVTRLLPRVEVRGGAGSGKTVLALTQAKQLSQGRSDRKAQRVALLCYSLGLAAYLKREVATWKRQHRPAFVGTFHEFGRQWGAPDGDRTDSEFWEVELPALMDTLAEGLPEGKKYDSIVVDEAQDFADSCGSRCSRRCAIPTRAGFTSTPTRTSGSSRASASLLFRWCRSCWTTTCAIRDRSTTCSGRWRRRG